MPTDQSKDLLKWIAIGAGVLGAATVLRSPTKDLDLRNKTVFITGGSRGLGLVLAREFANEGSRVAICARDEEELQRAKDDLESRGAEVMAIKCDVTNSAEVEHAVQQIEQRFGSIDVLVNNAGIIQVGPLESMTPEDFRRALKTHFWGPLNTILAVLPQMREKRFGRIINISSVGGKVSVPHLVPYSASKFALVGLSRGLRSELKKDGILVTTVCPGLMRTGSPRNAEFKGRHRAEYAWFSMGDALPFTSIDARRAARQIVKASKTGRAELVISIQAKMVVLLDSLFPELSADIFSAMDRFLPAPGGIGERTAKGKESTSAWSPSFLTTLNEKAAAINNEFALGE